MCNSVAAGPYYWCHAPNDYVVISLIIVQTQQCCFHISLLLDTALRMPLAVLWSETCSIASNKIQLSATSSCKQSDKITDLLV